MVKKNNRKSKSNHETLDQIQKSMARALLGIISLAIFIAFFLVPR